MAKTKGVNEKKQKGMELKAVNKATKDSAKAADNERQEAAEWGKGANNKGASRAAAAASKADEAAKKRAEKAALLAAEDAEMGSTVKPKATQKSKKKGKKKNDLALLEDALIGGAEKKAKADKRLARLKKEKEETLKKEKAKKDAEEMKTMDPLLANTSAMIGDTTDGKQLNASLIPGEVQASGLDAAMNALSVSTNDDHPEKRMKALHKAFEEKMMPEMKEQYPGLKRSQYLQKIFALWKKSPENPMNAQPL